MARVLHPDDAVEIAEYVQSRGFKRVAVQVPDGRLLRDAPLLAAAVRAALTARRRRQRPNGGGGDKKEAEEEEEELFILADTSANPLAVDEVAAAHVSAHCVVHFGPASLTRTSRTPALCVLPRRALPPPPPPFSPPSSGVAGSPAAVPAGGGGATGVGVASAGEGAGAGSGGRGGAREDERGAADEAGAREDGCGGADEAGALALAALIGVQLREEAAAAAAAVEDGPAIRAAVVLLDQGYVHALPRVEAATLALLERMHAGDEEAGDRHGAAAPAPLPLPWPVAFARPLPRVLEPEEGVAECLSLQRQPGAAATAGATASVADPAAAAAAGGGRAAATETAAAAADADAPAAFLTGAGLQWSIPDGASRSNTLLMWVGPLVDSDATATEEAESAATIAGGDGERERQDEREEAATAAAAGPAAAPLARLQLVYSDAPWRAFDPRLGPAYPAARGIARACQLLRRRRRFAVSAAHGAPMVGVLVGTLGAAGFREAVSAVRALALAAGKRPYTLLVGKPSPAKLANFPELGCFVHVTDPEGALLLAAAAGGGAGAGGGGSGGFLAPVVTPHEAAVAFGAAARGLDAFDAVALLESRPYSLGFDTVVREAREVAAEAEAGAGGGGGAEDGDGDDGGGRALAATGGAGYSELAPVRAAADIIERGARALAVSGGARAVEPATAAEFLLLRRGYKGLETPAATGAPEKRAALAGEGRLGRAAGYDEEGER